ncbi:unnamed protein product [Owenia fusiformis]|uniref:DED domain-containing protein n=2 Tax=Owenia fusiformis TaxID=6347 RepID=A0A8S4P5E6_OWEFU|nr:unnamed protein product [Owenia fusiformis]
MAQSLLAQSALLSLNSMGHTSNLRRFLLKLSKQLTDDNVDDLKYLVEDYVDGAPNIKNALDLFRKLQKVGVICDTNVDKLIELLREIERDDLVQKVITFKEDNIEAVFAMSMPAYRQPQRLDISSEPVSANPSVPTNGGLLGPDMPNNELKFDRDKSANSLHGPKIPA